MSKVFNCAIENLRRMSGYDYDFLVDTDNEIMDSDGSVDWNYFVGVTMEHDW